MPKRVQANTYKRYQAQWIGIDAKQANGNVTQISTASVALAAAVAAQKPRLLSRNMIQLYAIMTIGYLFSTMNGLGM